MKQSKRLVSLILTLAFAFSLVTTSAMAAAVGDDAVSQHMYCKTYGNQLIY